MNFGLRRAGRAQKASIAEAGEQEGQQPQATKRRARLQMTLVGACALGVFFGARLSHSGAKNPVLTEAVLQGTWELQSLHDDPIGPDKPSAVLSQRVRFADGKLHGETVLRADTETATTAMPFPDESVTRVDADADGHEVRVLWDGTYQFQDHEQIALHIGKAVYFVKAAWLPDKNSLQFNQDAILTFQGKALYQRAASKTGSRVLGF